VTVDLHVRDRVLLPCKERRQSCVALRLAGQRECAPTQEHWRRDDAARARRDHGRGRIGASDLQQPTDVLGGDGRLVAQQHDGAVGVGGHRADAQPQGAAEPGLRPRVLDRDGAVGNHSAGRHDRHDGFEAGLRRGSRDVLDERPPGHRGGRLRGPESRGPPRGQDDGGDAHRTILNAAYHRPVVEGCEILIEGGTVVDGSGSPGFAASVAVRDGRIATLPRDHEPVNALRRIDATGRVVAPGFIDLHSHSGLMLFADPLHAPKVLQGVTTEVIGVDGLSYAPVPDPADLEALVRMNAGLDGAPEGLSLDWSTVESYMRRLDALQPSVNLAFLVGNSALRIAEIGWEDVPASERALANMRAMLREALAHGAVGISSGLDYPPGAYADTDELAALTREAATAGGFYHTHVRYDLGDRYLDPFREAIEIGRRASGAVHITHFYHRQTFPGGPEPMLALVDEARADGLDVTFDTYPYEWASTRLLIMIPTWVQAGGPARTLERLGDRAVRDRIRSELAERGVLFAGDRAWDHVRLGAFRRPELVPWEGKTLGDVIDDRGEDPVDVLCDLLLAEDLRLNQVTPGPWSETLPHFLTHPVGMIGTDSTFVGSKPSPRTYGSFPRVLGQFVRDEARLSVEEAVRRMTSAPAARLGLGDRGVIRDGAIADLVIFDPARVRSNATYEEPRRHPDGIDWVIVGGRLVVDAGAHTRDRPGRVLRRGR
jgi:N-acyl-D-amino-acid deacylase